jgi:hypothetical protein
MAACHRGTRAPPPATPTNRLPDGTVVQQRQRTLRRWRRFGAAFDLVALNRKENPVSIPTRRTFLQTAVAAAASLLLPRGVRAGGTSGSFWFLHAPTGESWAVEDPVVWPLEHAHEPILERARDRLVTLTAADPKRVIRLVVRPCRLNLVELRPGRVVVHHWGQQGQADLRPFFKKHSLAKQGMAVFLIDRKREVVAARPGTDFLYGTRLPQDFPPDLYRRKW